MSKSVLFFKNRGCPHCKMAEPIFKEVTDLHKEDIDAQIIDITDDIQKAVSSFNNSISDFFEKNRVKSIDISILGMGPDGHTASLFPHNNDYLSSLDSDNISFHTYFKQQKEYRISLGPQILMSSRTNILIITGDEKGRVLKQALTSNNFQKYPIKTVLTDEIVVFMDQDCLTGFESKD